MNASHSTEFSTPPQRRIGGTRKRQVRKKTSTTLISGLVVLALVQAPGQPESPQPSSAAVTVTTPESGNGVLFWIPEPGFLLPVREASAHEAVLESGRVKKVLARWENEKLTVLPLQDKAAAIAAAGSDFQERTDAAADAELAKAHEIKARSQGGVVEAVILSSERETFCAALLAPSLHEKFAELLGEEFYAAMPTRFRMYLFPKLGGRPEAFAKAVLSDYRASPAPVSPELFEISRNGPLRAAGVLDDR